MKKNLKANLCWVALIVVAYIAISLFLASSGARSLYYVQIIEQIGINIILAVGLNMIVGSSGQFSLGHAGFMALGAYATAIVGQYMPSYGGFFISVIMGMIVAGLVALLVGLPTLRLKGDYLAIATLGVAEIIRILIVNGDSLTNGARGISGIPPFTSWQLVFAFVVITTVLSLNFMRSATGRGIMSVREDEIAAESVGVNTTKMKVLAFVFGAMTAAIAGSLQAGYVGTVRPTDFAFLTSVNVLIIIVFGGLGSYTGSFLAAIVLGVLNMALQSVSDVRMIIYSLALILVMVFRPSGLLGRKELSFSKFFDKKKEEK